jgi:hypothetical protein
MDKMEKLKNSSVSAINEHEGHGGMQIHKERVLKISTLLECTFPV